MEINSLKDIENFSLKSNIYMNFKVENNGEIYGVIEGVGGQTSFVNANHFDEYKTFLIQSINYLSQLEKSVHFTPEMQKYLKKFKMYLKRTETAENKLQEITQSKQYEIMSLLNKMKAGKIITLSDREMRFDKELNCICDSEGFSYTEYATKSIVESYIDGVEYHGIIEHDDYVEHGFYG